jgi:hypothetical protein
VCWRSGQAHLALGSWSGTLIGVKLIGVLVLPAAMVIGLAYVETRVVGDSSPSSYARARGVVWAGHTFVDRAQLSRWLRSRGVRYRVWAQRHPALSGITPRRKAGPTARRAVANGADHRSSWMSAALVGGAAVLAVLLLVLVVRDRRLARWVGRILSAFPRPPGPRGVAFQWRQRDRPSSRWRGKLGRALGVVAVHGPAFVLRLRRWRHRAGMGLPAARRSQAYFAAGVARDARLILRRGAAARLLLSARVASAAFSFRRRRSALAWCLATVLLAAGTGLAVTAWLNGA